MKFKLRALAWGCVAAGMSVAAHAAPVTFDFNDLGALAGTAGTPLSNQYQGQGLLFAGDALAYHNGAASGNLLRVPCRPDRNSCTQPNGFVSNSSNGGGFTISVAADRSFTGLLMDYAVGSLSFNFTVFSRPDANNVVQSVVHNIQGTGGSWSDWTSGLDALSGPATPKGVAILTATGFGDIDRIVFAPTGSGAFFAIDNLVFADSGTSGGGGGTVPEPASLALVALALAAYGTVCRRSRQA